MEDNHGAYEPAVVGGGGADQRQVGFLPLPRLRAQRRFRAAAYFAAWGVAGLLSTTTVPGLAPNPDHIFLYFLFLMAGVLLLLLGVAAQDLPVADRLAARFEGWIAALF